MKLALEELKYAFRQGVANEQQTNNSSVASTVGGCTFQKIRYVERSLQHFTEICH